MMEPIKVSAAAGLLRALEMVACDDCGLPLSIVGVHLHNCRATNIMARATWRPKVGSAASLLTTWAKQRGPGDVAVWAYMRQQGLTSTTRPAGPGREERGAGQPGREPLPDLATMRAGPSEELLRWEDMVHRLIDPGGGDQVHPDTTGLAGAMGLGPQLTPLIAQSQLQDARREFVQQLEAIVLAAGQDDTPTCSSHALAQAWLRLLAIPAKYAQKKGRGAQEAKEGEDTVAQRRAGPAYFLLDELMHEPSEEDVHEWATTRAQHLVHLGRISDAANVLANPQPPVPMSVEVARQMRELHPVEQPLSEREVAQVHALVRQAAVRGTGGEGEISLTLSQPSDTTGPAIPAGAAMAVLQRVRAAAVAVAASEGESADAKRTKVREVLSSALEALKDAAFTERKRQMGELREQTEDEPGQEQEPERPPTPEPEEPRRREGMPPHIALLVPGLEEQEDRWEQAAGVPEVHNGHEEATEAGEEEEKSDIPSVRDGAAPADTVRPLDSHEGTLAHAEWQALRRACPGSNAIPRILPRHLVPLAASLPAHRAAGPSGMTYEMLRQLLGRDAYAFTLFTAVVRLLMVGRGGPAPILMASRAIALRKGQAAVRPIAIGEVIMRLVGLAMTRLAMPTLVKVLAPHQVGVGLRGGTEVVGWASQLARLSGHCIMSVDARNAFNSVSRRQILRECAQHVPALLPLSCWALAAPTPLWLRDSKKGATWVMASATGVPQGWPLSPALFALAEMPVLLTVAQVLENVPALPRPGIDTHVREDCRPARPEDVGVDGDEDFINTIVLEANKIAGALHSMHERSREQWPEARWEGYLEKAVRALGNRVMRADQGLAETLQPEAVRTLLERAGAVRGEDGTDERLAEWMERATRPETHLPTLVATCNALVLQDRPDWAMDAAAWWAVCVRAAGAERGWLQAWAAATAGRADGRKEQRAIMAYADDVTVSGDWDALLWSYRALEAEYAAVNLEARRDKSVVLAPGASVLADGDAETGWLRGEQAGAGGAPPDEETRAGLPHIVHDGIVVAGTPVGTPAFCAEHATQVARQSRELVHKARGLTAQSQYQLLRLSVSAQVRHLTRTLPLATMAEAVRLHDEALGEGLAACTGVSGWRDLPEPGPLRAEDLWLVGHEWGTDRARDAALTFARDMPLRLGGLGVSPIAQSANAAFVGSLALVAREVAVRYPGLGPSRGADRWTGELLRLGPVQRAGRSCGDAARVGLASALSASVSRLQRALHQPSVELAFWSDTMRLAVAEYLRFDEGGGGLLDPGGRACRMALEWRLMQLTRGASTWLQALPSSRGSRVADDDFNAAIAGRMGLHLTSEGPHHGAEAHCPRCGNAVPTSPNGMAHALVCQGRSKTARHDRVVRELRTVLKHMGCHADTEQPIYAVADQGGDEARNGELKIDVVAVDQEHTRAYDVTIVSTKVNDDAARLGQALVRQGRDFNLRKFVEDALLPFRKRDAGVRRVGGEQAPTFMHGIARGPVTGQSAPADPLGLYDNAHKAARDKQRKYGDHALVPSPHNPAQLVRATVLPFVMDPAGGLAPDTAKALKATAKATAAIKAEADHGVLQSRVLHIAMQLLSTAVIVGNAHIWKNHVRDRAAVQRTQQQRPDAGEDAPTPREDSPDYTHQRNHVQTGQDISRGVGATTTVQGVRSSRWSAGRGGRGGARGGGLRNAATTSHRQQRATTTTTTTATAAATTSATERVQERRESEEGSGRMETEEQGRLAASTTTTTTTTTTQSAIQAEESAMNIEGVT